MRKRVVLLMALGACQEMPPEYEYRHGLTKEELEAGPSYHRINGALLNDRKWRALPARLEEGKPARPACIVDQKEGAQCANDGEKLEYYPLKNDLPDQPNRVEESAYYCRKESVYYYHYVGGLRKWDVWMGPFKLDRAPRKLEE